MFDRQAQKITGLIHDNDFFDKLTQGDAEAIGKVTGFLEQLMPENLPIMQKNIARWIECLKQIGIEKAVPQVKDLGLQMARNKLKRNLVGCIQEASKGGYGAFLTIDPPTKFYYCSSADDKSKDPVDAKYIESKVGFRFTNNVQIGVEDSLKDADLETHFSHSQSISPGGLNARLSDAIENFGKIEIFRMGDIQGHAPRVRTGVIKKSQTCGISTGKSFVGTSHITDDYSLGSASCIDPAVRFIGNIYGKEGGLGFLFAHAPMSQAAMQEFGVSSLSYPTTLELFKFNPGIDTNQIATANIAPKVFLVTRPHSQNPNIILSTPVILFIALRDILPGEVLAFDYELFWWVIRNAPFDLFYTNGKLLDPTSYSMKSYYIYAKFSDDEVIYAFNRDDLVALSKYPKELIEKLGNIQLISENKLHTTEVKFSTILENFNKSPRACGMKISETKDQKLNQDHKEDKGISVTLRTDDRGDKRCSSVTFKLFRLPSSQQPIRSISQEADVELKSTDVPKSVKEYKEKADRENSNFWRRRTVLVHKDLNDPSYKSVIVAPVCTDYYSQQRFFGTVNLYRESTPAPKQNVANLGGQI